MDKYKEIVQSLRLGKFLNRRFYDFYGKLEDFSKQVVSENSLRMTDGAKEGLVNLASVAIQVGSSSVQYRKTKKMVMGEGISEDRLPHVFTAASLACIVDMAVIRFKQKTGKSEENSPKLLYQALDFLTSDEVQYLGL